MTEMYDYLRKNQGLMLEQLERIVRQESPSNQKRLVDACGETISNLFQTELGISPEILVQNNAGDHLVAKIGSGDKRILCLGHFDTVWDPGVIQYRVENGRAYGPGIFDMKAGIVQGIWALKAIQQCQMHLNAEGVFLLTSDEEVGSTTSRQLIEAHARNADYVFVLEPSVGKTGAIKTSRKGTGIYNIRAHGVASHAGNHPEAGASAVHELCRQVTAITKFENTASGTTINVGTFHGGTRTNVVADEAFIQVDVRVSELPEADRVESAFQKLTPYDSRVKLTIDGGINRPPMSKSPRSGQLFDMAKSIAERHLGFELHEASVGGGSDGNFTSALGIPTLDGLGAVGDGPHAEYEHILIDGLSQRAALLAHLILSVQ